MPDPREQDCPECGAEIAICECPKPTGEPSKWERELQALQDGSGRIQASGGDADTREDSDSSRETGSSTSPSVERDDLIDQVEYWKERHLWAKFDLREARLDLVTYTAAALVLGFYAGAILL